MLINLPALDITDDDRQKATDCLKALRVFADTPSPRLYNLFRVALEHECCRERQLDKTKAELKRIKEEKKTCEYPCDCC